jgi:hypothetical protein
MTNSPRPPAHVEAFVRVLGTEGAIEFLLAFGGAELYLPEVPTPKSKLVQLVGLEKARALVDASAYLPRRIPTAKPWIAAVWASQSVAKAEIARRLHVTDVTVRSWLSKSEATVKRDPRQSSLF